MTNTLRNKWSSFSESDLTLFRLITKITYVNNCPYFLIGAKARDILLAYFGKNEAQRATIDTDIAISCKNWDAFYKIKNAFINNGDFFADDKQDHRVLSNKYGCLAILPFGDISEKSPNIKWPPEYDIELGIIGFDDAYKNAMNINVNDITIKVTSPLGLVLLKLLAWLSRKAQKDVNDFTYFISNYFDFGNQDRFHEQHQDLLDENFDYTLSGCRLLGRDFQNLSLETKRETKSRLNEFFNNEHLIDGLAISMSKTQLSYDIALTMLLMIRVGFNDSAS